MAKVPCDDRMRSGRCRRKASQIVCALVEKLHLPSLQAPSLHAVDSNVSVAICAPPAVPGLLHFPLAVPSHRNVLLLFLFIFQPQLSNYFPPEGCPKQQVPHPLPPCSHGAGDRDMICSGTSLPTSPSSTPPRLHPGLCISLLAGLLSGLRTLQVHSECLL